MESSSSNNNATNSMVRWVILAVFIVTSVVLIINFKALNKESSKLSQNEKVEETTTTTKTQKAPKKATKSEYNQNEVADVDGVKYKIVKVEKIKPDKEYVIGKDYNYVVVHIKIDNNSSEKVAYNPYFWKMENSNGQESDNTIPFGRDNTDILKSGSLNPGGSVTGVVAFKEPQNDKGLKLNHYKKAYSKDNATFKIKID